MYVDGYVSWTQDGQVITEKIFSWTIWLDELRMTIVDAAMSLKWSGEGKVILHPHVSVSLCDVYPKTYPAKVLFEIYAGTELRASEGMACDLRDGTTFSMISPDEDIVLEDIAAPEELSMRVTVTDRQGNEFEADWKFSDEAA